MGEGQGRGAEGGEHSAWKNKAGFLREEKNSLYSNIGSRGASRHSLL